MSNNNEKVNNLTKKDKVEKIKFTTYLPIDLYNRLIANFNQYNSDSNIQLTMSQYLRKVLSESLT